MRKGRPKKDLSVKRNKRLTLNFTEGEFKTLEKRAKEAGMSINEMVRTAGLKGEIKKPDPNVRILAGEINRIGINLNTLVKKVHSGGTLYAPDINNVLNGLKIVFLKLEEKARQIILTKYQ